jgi:hypothetical protein
LSEHELAEQGFPFADSSTALSQNGPQVLFNAGDCGDFGYFGQCPLSLAPPSKIFTAVTHERI